MWKELCRFEIRFQLRQPLFILAALGLFGISLAMMSTNAAVALSDSPAVTYRNAPFVIVNSMAAMTIMGLFVITAFVASAALRDFDRGTHMLFFTKPVKKLDYLMGRFIGSTLVSILLFGFMVVGMLAAEIVPWQDAARMGPFSFSPYIYGFLVFVVPNLILMGAMFFAVSILSRKAIAAYVLVVVFWGVQDWVEELVSKMTDTHALGLLLEPTGVGALSNLTRYWTITEFNSILPSITGGLLQNRLVWLALGLIILVLGCWRFNYTRALSRRKVKALVVADDCRVSAIRSAPLRLKGRFGFRTGIRQLLRQTRVESLIVMKSNTFIILLLLGLLFVLCFTWFAGQERGTDAYPLTQLMVTGINISMGMMLVIIITFYIGEMVWYERSRMIAPLLDSLPIPNWVLLGAKILTLLMIIVVFNLTGVLAGVLLQISRGYFHFEPLLYLKGCLIMSVRFLLLGVLAVLLQVLSPNKFIGFLAIIMFFMIRTIAGMGGLTHFIYRYPEAGRIQYSDMNGYGHFMQRFISMNIYWGFVALGLLVLAVLFWTRGSETGLNRKLKTAGERWRGRTRVVTWVAAAGTLLMGGYVFYNTNILNTYMSSARERTLCARYEKEYLHYKAQPQPRITGIYADVDIFPEERRVEIAGRYDLVNKTPVSIGELYVSLNPFVRIEELKTGQEAVSIADDECGFRVYQLADSIAPGEGRTLEFSLIVENPGFVCGSANAKIVANGTFFENSDYFPIIGYSEQRELIDPNHRRRHGLSPKGRMAAVDDERARQDNCVTPDADWIDFETTVSTSMDQIAIAPGYLQREWVERGRRYFHYKMDSPILNFFSYVSADYAVRRDTWNDVALEIYYQEGHEYNLERMMKGMKSALDYCSANFSPYQHRQLRIIEFPGYNAYAQSFANTIPFSEAAGFISHVKNRDMDMVFNRTAHEVAHQWWAHQVIGANVQGATMLMESLAEYSALMVMEKEYGPEKIHRFLSYELDGYLVGRGEEVVCEQPLMLVENQMYLHYNKGCLVMYALRDYIGEAAVNRAISSYISDTAFQEPPYTTTVEFLEYIRRETPDSLAYIIEDMFETITLFDNRATGIHSRRLEDGRYLVTIDLLAAKMRADGLGVEEEIPMNDWVDIGVFADVEGGEGPQEEVLYLRKHRIQSGEDTLEIVVDREPSRAGIDPFNKLIDRKADDNVRTLGD
ncbi:MAG: hypothetical protein GY835_07695 [bacterium]|nr:hypothetical protein [bacterium]